MTFRTTISLSLTAVLLTTSLASAFDAFGGKSVEDILQQQGLNTPDKEPIHIQFPNIGNNQPQIDPGSFPIHVPGTGNTGGMGADFSVQLQVGGRLEAALACESAGGGDVLLTNVGEVSLPVGTKAHWQMAGQRGAAVLNRSMSPGTSFKVLDVLDYDSDDLCRARVI